LVIWLFGYLVIWLFGYLVIWLFGYLVILGFNREVQHPEMVGGEVR